MKMARSKDGDGIKSTLIIAEVQKRPILYDANHQAHGERVLKMQSWEEVCQAVLPEWASMSTSERHASGKEIQKRWRSIRDSYTKAYRQGKCAPPGAVPPGGGRRSQHQRQMVFLYNALQRKVPRTSIDKAAPDTEPTSPLDDPPLSVVKLENNNEELTQPPKTYHNKKRTETRVNSDTNTSVEEDKQNLDIKNTLETQKLESKTPENADLDTSIEANILKDIRNASEMRNLVEMKNPSLEIKIDANSILPEDHFDDDRLFMNSLLPFFKKMDDNTRLTCRIEMLKIIKCGLQIQNSFDVPKQPTEVTVKEESKSSVEATEPNKVLKTSVPSQTTSLRMCRKRKAVSLPESAMPRRRGPGRPRKEICYDEQPPLPAGYRYADSDEDAGVAAAVASARRRPGRRAAARKRDGARTAGERERERECRLTPDEEEMYRATSVTQLKPPQFLKMYNLEPAKKPAVAAAPATPDPAAVKKDAS